MSGSIVSNTVTVPVGLPNGPCFDPDLSYSGSQFQSLAAKTNVEVGTILVGEGLFPSIWAVNAMFQVQQSGLYGSGYGDASEGSCVVMSPAANPFRALGLDAGTITVSWPGGLELLNEAPVGIYPGSLTAGPSNPGSQGIQFSFAGVGGKDIPSFTSGVTIESPPLSWTNQSALTSITRSQGTTVTWTDSTSGLDNSVEIRGASSLAGGTPVAFVCHAPVAAGSFAIPPSILMALPPGSGTLSVAHFYNALDPADGLFDLFQAIGRVVASQNVTYN
jgi:hypothetical protein